MLLPLLIVLTLMLSLGVAYLLSALTVTYRDFRFLIPFIGAGLDVAELRRLSRARAVVGRTKWRMVLALNPMYGIIAGYRRAAAGRCRRRRLEPDVSRRIRSC